MSASYLYPKDMVGLLCAMNTKLLEGHLRILSTPWIYQCGAAICPHCDLLIDAGCTDYNDCARWESMRACGIADEPEGGE